MPDKDPTNAGDPAHLGSDKTPSDDTAEPGSDAEPTGTDQAKANEEVDPPA